MIPSAIAPWKLSASLFIRAEKVTYFPPVPGGGQRSRYSRSFRPGLGRSALLLDAIREKDASPDER